ncbi:MAG: formate dehydrogenase subunit gamma [Planctomycetes bacterium]|nr:formate dehydrogenase subunit gamma [Planctomycetota bacterium]
MPARRGPAGSAAAVVAAGAVLLQHAAEPRPPARMHESRSQAVPVDPAAERAAIEAAIEQCRDLRGATLPMLHAIQDRLGYVPAAAVDAIAAACNLSRADVHGVLTFYHDFRTAPPGRHVLKVCRAEACQAMGCERLERHLADRCGIAMRGTTADGALTVEPVYCLGNCALSPSVLLDGRLHGRVTPERLDALLAAAEARA